MKIGLIHANPASLKPTEKAIKEVGAEATFIHFLDSGLLPLLQKEKELTPTVVRRFIKLTNQAADYDVDCIQLTCSAFNDLTKILQPLYDATLFRSDEAMLDLALSFNKIGLLSTVNETPPVLQRYLEKRNPVIQIRTLVNTEAMESLQAGDQETHDLLVQQMIKEIELNVDVIVLSQYSMAHVAKQVDVKVPILTGPGESVKRCLNHVQLKN